MTYSRHHRGRLASPTGAEKIDRGPIIITTTANTFDLTYLDQSSNRYRFWRTTEAQPARFIYDPVQPEHSSSGVYSGGSRQQGELSQQQVEDLLDRARALEAATALHTDKRQMGTGSFRIREVGDDGTEGETRRFILRGGAQRREFEAFLEPFRG